MGRSIMTCQYSKMSLNKVAFIGTFITGMWIFTRKMITDGAFLPQTCYLSLSVESTTPRIFDAFLRTSIREAHTYSDLPKNFLNIESRLTSLFLRARKIQFAKSYDRCTFFIYFFKNISRVCENWMFYRLVGKRWNFNFMKCSGGIINYVFNYKVWAYFWNLSEVGKF